MTDARATFALGQLLSAAVALSAAAPAIESLSQNPAGAEYGGEKSPLALAEGRRLRDELADARAIVTQMVHELDAAMGSVLDELAARDVRRQRGEMLPGLPAALASLEAKRRQTATEMWESIAPGLGHRTRDRGP